MWKVFFCLFPAILVGGYLYASQASAFPHCHEALDFQWSDSNNPYLKELRIKFNLDEVVAESQSDYDKVLAITHWVHRLWEHHGKNQPEKNDPISIIEEAKQGKRFRCVEYGIVVAGCLNSLGIPARVLGLKTADMETREYGAGHVVTEAYLKEMEKWVMIDGQHDLIPLLDGKPLNAFELRKALMTSRDLLSITGNVDPFRSNEYFDWIEEYLFYFDVPLDNRYLSNRSEEKVMLVPKGANKPKVFQRKNPLKNVVYTESVQCFYQKPYLSAYEDSGDTGS